MSAAGRAARRALGPALVLGAVAAFFAPLALPGRALVFRDAVVYAAPQDAVLREALLARHELPARNPWLYGGVAFLADPSNQALYPPRVACALLFAPPRSLHVAAVLHFGIAALGAYALGRALRVPRAGAVAGAAVYALSGPVLSLAENLPLLAGAAWLPWAPALALEAARAPAGPRRTRDAALAGVAVGLCALGGDLQAATWAGLLVLGIAARASLRERRPHVALGAPLLALLLGGAVLIPAWHLRPATSRARVSDAEAGRWSLAPARARELVVPFPWGVSFPDGQTVVDGLSPGPERVTEPWCETAHVGALGLALGALALGSRRHRRRVAALLGLGALAFVLALGPRTPLWAIVREAVPFYSVYRHPEKHLVLLALAGSALAATGIAALREPAARRRGALALLVLAILIAAPAAVSWGPAFSAVAARSVRPHGDGALLARQLSGALLRTGLVVFLGTAVALTAFHLRRRWVLAVVAFAVALDVGMANRPRLFLGDERLHDEHPLGVDLVRHSGSRVLRFPWVGGPPFGRIPGPEETPYVHREERAIAARVRSWTGSVAARERVPALHGFASFVPAGIERELLDSVAGASPGALPPPDVLDRLGVRWLVLDARVAERAGLSPALRSAQGVVLVDRGEAIAQAPAPVFGGESVPGLGAGAAASLAGAALVAVALTRRKRT